MGKRKKPEEIKRLLAEAERDLAKGLSVADVCRKTGVSEATYHRWRQRFSSAKPDESRQIKELLSEVARLKELVAELLLDKRMLQDVAKKSGDSLPAEGLCGLPPGDLSDLRKKGGPGSRPVPLDAPLPTRLARRRRAAGQGHQAVGPQAPPLGLPAHPCSVGAQGLDGEHQTRPPTVA
jgi:transposase-like protein